MGSVMFNRRTLGKLLGSLAIFPIDLTVGAPRIWAASKDLLGGPVREWDSDRRVFVLNQSTDTVDRFVIIGDIVELSPATFPSLVRPDGGEISKSTELVIEGRHVLVDMPLRFRDGRVTILAHTVEVLFDGLIGFVTAPTEAGQSLSITAELLSMAKARSFPFSFRTEVPGRNINFACVSITGRSGPVPAEAFEGMIRSMTLGSAGPGNPMTLSYGEQAAEEYKGAIAAASWPDATALKVQRFHSMDPYDDANALFAVAKADELLRACRGTERSTVWTAVDRVRVAAGQRRDLFGLLETDVPMLSLELAVERMRDLLGSVFDSKLLERWDRQALNSATVTPIDTPKLDALVARRDEALDTMAKLGRRGFEIDGALTDLAAKIDATDGELGNRKIHLQQMTEAERNKEANDGITTGIGIAAAVGSVAFPAAAPFLMVAAGIAKAATVIKHADGDVMATATSLVEVAQSQKAIMDLSLKVRENLDNLKAGFGTARKYVSDRSAMTVEETATFEEWKTNASGLKDGVTKLVSALQPAKPTARLEDTAPGFDGDGVIDTLVRRRNVLVGEQSTLLGEQVITGQQYASAASRVLEIDSQLSELQRLNVANDGDRQRYRLVADHARRTILGGLAREGMLLGRALDYLVPAGNTTSVELADFVDGENSITASALLTSADGQETALIEARERREAIYKTMLLNAEAARQGLSDQQRWNVASPVAVSAKRDGLSGTAAHRKQMNAFLDDLNGCLRTARTDGTSKAVPLPFRPGIGIATTNAFLLGINVSKLKFAKGFEPEGQFTLYIEHPRFGEIYRAGRSAYFSDWARERDSALSLTPARWPVTLPNDVSGDWKQRVALAQALFRIKDTMLPLLSDYSVRAEILNRDSWSQAPVIEEIDIELIGVGPR